MTRYRVVSEQPLDEQDVLYKIEARHWWTLWLSPVVFSVICRSPGLTVVDVLNFNPVGLYIEHAIVCHLDLVGKRERRKAAAIKEKYQQEGLEG